MNDKTLLPIETNLNELVTCASNINIKIKYLKQLKKSLGKFVEKYPNSIKLIDHEFYQNFDEEINVYYYPITIRFLAPFLKKHGTSINENFIQNTFKVEPPGDFPSYLHFQCKNDQYRRNIITINDKYNSVEIEGVDIEHYPYLCKCFDQLYKTLDK